MNIVVTAQIIGYIATATTLYGLQQKKIERILIIATISNALSALSNLIIGGITGGVICGIAVVQTLISYVYHRRKKPVFLWVPFFFIACYIAVTVLAFTGPLDALPCLAAVLYAVGVTQKSPAMYRILMLFNSTAWIIYELTLPIPNWAMAITFGLQLAATVVGIVRVDLKQTHLL